MSRAESRDALLAMTLRNMSHYLTFYRNGPLMGQKFALLIGNNDYQDSALARLAKPIADVQGLADVLKEPTIGAFDNVTPLINCSAADVRLEVESFFADKKPDDLLLLYCAGHGARV